ncbi:flagellar hook-length control protein FliK [Ketogulonicigenium robustum]|uniref:flagellar hook-length control protein FliK n=1 Tax=Ketogulonicigenium robustum TaxID=92947 RepID=UPI0018DBC0CD|nr:flagellar hook-length control protein FliK [Ketogulonicigenium robustum]
MNLLAGSKALLPEGEGKVAVPEEDDGTVEAFADWMGTEVAPQPLVTPAAVPVPDLPALPEGEDVAEVIPQDGLDAQTPLPLAEGDIGDVVPDTDKPARPTSSEAAWLLRVGLDVPVAGVVQVAPPPTPEQTADLPAPPQRDAAPVAAVPAAPQNLVRLEGLPLSQRTPPAPVPDTADAAPLPPTPNVVATAPVAVVAIAPPASVTPPIQPAGPPLQPAREDGDELLPDVPFDPQTTTLAPHRARALGLAQLPPPHVAGVLNQIEAAVARKGEGVVEIALSPEELGRLRLTLSEGQGGMVMQIQADRPETLDLLRRNLDQLAADLRDLGYGSVDFSFHQQSQSDEPDTAPQARRMTYADGVAADAAPLTPRPAPLRGQLDIRI